VYLFLRHSVYFTKFCASDFGYTAASAVYNHVLSEWQGYMSISNELQGVGPSSEANMPSVSKEVADFIEFRCLMLCL
jgi:hypothetical protein